MEVHVEKKGMTYKGRQVTGRKLIATSELPISINLTWNELQKSSLLTFVTRGLITFKPIGEAFPATWKEGMELKTRMRLWGLFPVGGIHELKFIKINPQNRELLTQEQDREAKIWNHRIQLTDLEPGNKTRYTDEIEIYGGWLTPIVTLFANVLFMHRHRRWQLYAGNIAKA